MTVSNAVAAKQLAIMILLLRKVSLNPTEEYFAGELATEINPRRVTTSSPYTVDPDLLTDIFENSIFRKSVCSEYPYISFNRRSQQR
jgi:hypothetical protein